MPEERQITFGPFRLDADNARLWRGHQTVRLSPKVFTALRYLAERPGRLVTKDDLFQAVWPEVVVSDATLTVCIRELRKALKDSSRTPRFIETIPKRGYRWIAE